VTAAASHALDILAHGADAIRMRWLRLVAPFLGGTLSKRNERVVLSLTVGIVLSLSLTIIAPIALLAVGPVVWGIPHLLADVRYLVVPQALHRRRALWAAIFAPVVLAAFTPLGSRAGLVAIVGASVAAMDAPRTRRALVFVLGCAAVAIGWFAPRATDLVLAHAHNVVALGLLWAITPGNRRHLAIPFGVFVLGSAALLLGACDGWIDWSTHTNVTLGALLRTFAPFPTHLGSARRLLLAFAFAQSVHYAVWLRAIPDETREIETIRSFRQSARSIVRELGATLPLVAVMATVALAAWGAFDLVNARAGYLRFAGFHGHLEIALAALAWVEKRRP
jgi:hypothetical protein